MAKRRSLDDALTPDEEAFLKQQPPTTAKRTDPKPKSNPKKETPPMSKPAFKETISLDESPPAKEASGYATAATGASNGAVNVRIDPKITTALLRSSFERRLAGQTPHTQRDIVAEAVTDWLKKHGYPVR